MHRDLAVVEEAGTQAADSAEGSHWDAALLKKS